MKLQKFVLASGSQRRAELIKKVLKSFDGVTLEIVKPEVDEPAPRVNEAPESYAIRLAVKKSEDVFFRLFSSESGTVVIGCDTVVALNGKIYLKPASKRGAVLNFRELCGNTHEVITAVSLRYKKDAAVKSVDFLEKTYVTFGAFDKKIVYNYVKKGKPFDKAGGYGIQDKELKPLVVSVTGDKDNVIGLPVGKIKDVLSTI